MEIKERLYLLQTVTFLLLAMRTLSNSKNKHRQYTE